MGLYCNVGVPILLLKLLLSLTRYIHFFVQ